MTRTNAKRTHAALAAPLLLLGLAALPQAARAQVAGSTSGLFSGYNPGANTAPDVTGVGTSDLKFGTASGGSFPNEFQFTGNSFAGAFGTPFNVGTFTYTNGTTLANTGIDSADLQATLTFTQPAGLPAKSFTYTVPVTLTPNGSGTAAGDADYITLPTTQPGETFTYGGTKYTLQFSGFDVNTLNPADGFLTGPGGGPGDTELHVFEGATASAGITATLTAATATPEPGTWAAFAFTGLGTAGLMLKARRRRAA